MRHLLQIFVLLLSSCSALAPIEPKTLYSSNADTPFFIQLDDSSLAFTIETHQCLASGFSATMATKVVVPLDTICQDSAATNTATFLGKGIGDILSGVVRGFLN